MISISKGPTQKGMTIDKFITEYKPVRYISKKAKKPKLKLKDETGDVVEVERGNEVVVPPAVKSKKKKGKKLSKKLKIV